MHKNLDENNRFSVGDMLIKIAGFGSCGRGYVFEVTKIREGDYPMAEDSRHNRHRFNHCVKISERSMDPFQVGDQVARTKSGGNYRKGHTFIIHRFVAHDDLNPDYRGFVVDSKGGFHNPKYLTLVNPEWRPRPGEMIEVSNHEDGIDAAPFVSTREFFCMTPNGRFLCKLHHDDPDNGEYYAYKKARRIKDTYTVTLENGQKVEISRESYKALCKGVQS